MREEDAQAVQQLIDWHADKVAQLNMVKDHPDAEIKLGNDEASAIILTGEQAKGFRVGITVALEYLGELPISLTQNDSDEEETE